MVYKLNEKYNGVIFEGPGEKNELIKNGDRDYLIGVPVVWVSFV
jgi:hypothetical protein